MVACPAVMDLMNEGTAKKSPVLYFHCFCCFHNITQGITYSSSLPAREYPTIRRASSRPSTDHRNPRRWPKEFVSPSGSTCTAAPSVSQTSIVYLVRIPVGIRRTWFNRNERIAQSTRPKRPISPDRCIGIASINDSLEHCSRPLTSAGAAAASLVHISMVMDRAQQEDDMEMTSSRLGINSYRRRGSSRAPLLRRDPSTAPDDCRCRLRPSRRRLAFFYPTSSSPLTRHSARLYIFLLVPSSSASLDRPFPRPHFAASYSSPCFARLPLLLLMYRYLIISLCAGPEVRQPSACKVDSRRMEWC